MVVPRELLLVEVERYCPGEGCGARNAVGLTKEEARVYDGYTCARCERRWPDSLSERDIPEWWEELTITSLEPARAPRGVGEETEGAVARLSAAWRAGGGRPGPAPDGEDGDGGGEGGL